MALPPLATLEDLSVWLGQNHEIDDARAAAVLAAASTLVRTETGKTWVDDDGNLLWAVTEDNQLLLLGDSITGIVCTAAARAYLNPNGRIQQMAGPFSEQLTPEAGQGLYLTDTEKDSLRKAIDIWHGRTPGVWALHTTRSHWPDTRVVARRFENTTTLFLDTDPEGDPIAWADPIDFP